MRESHRRSTRRLQLSLCAVFAAALVSLARPAPAAFHLAVIDEVMTSYDGDDSVQFVEIRMLFMFQNFVQNSVLAAFDAQGNHVGDLLVAGANLTNHGDGVRWVVGTEAFQTASALTPDFVMPAGMLPPAGGMVCFGGGAGAVFPQDPGTWDRTDFRNYVDCLAYGTYAGSANSRTGNPTPLSPVGHSLQRMSNSAPPDNATDFACAETATPENNAADTVELPATASCEPAPPCPGDCNMDGQATLNEIIRIVNVALGLVALGPCSPADTDGDGILAIDELVAAVASNLDECGAG
jgi:hypothetical protein